MNGLALCAGIGGLELGLRRVWPDLRTVCWVERDTFAASVLVSRMREGALDVAPVWDDLATFNGSEWGGCVDLVSAGYPCQPFSVAGKRSGESDERHLWPHVARVIREVGPRWVVLENVPGHVSLGLSDVLGELAEMGFDAEWGCYTAEQAGCAHRRERLFVLAHACNTRQREGQDAGTGGGDAAEDGCGSLEPQRDRREPVANAQSVAPWVEAKQARWQGPQRGSKVGDASGRVEPEPDDRGPAVGSGRQSRPIARWASLRPPGPDDADAWEWLAANDPDASSVVEVSVCTRAGGLDDSPGRESGTPVLRQGDGPTRPGRNNTTGFCGSVPPGPDDADAWEWLAANDPDALPAVEPGVRGVADGLPERLEPTVRRHRLRCLGNAVVPAQAALAVSDLLGVRNRAE